MKCTNFKNRGGRQQTGGLMEPHRAKNRLGRPVGNESPKFAQTFFSGRKAGDGPKFAENFSQRRVHPNFEKNLSKLWPGPTYDCPGPRASCPFLAYSFEHVNIQLTRRRAGSGTAWPSWGGEQARVQLGPVGVVIPQHPLPSRRRVVGGSRSGRQIVAEAEGAAAQISIVPSLRDRGQVLVRGAVGPHQGDGPGEVCAPVKQWELKDVDVAVAPQHRVLAKRRIGLAAHGVLQGKRGLPQVWLVVRERVVGVEPVPVASPGPRRTLRCVVVCHEGTKRREEWPIEGGVADGSSGAIRASRLALQMDEHVLADDDVVGTCCPLEVQHRRRVRLVEDNPLGADAFTQARSCAVDQHMAASRVELCHELRHDVGARVVQLHAQRRPNALKAPGHPGEVAAWRV
eukprot:scaffold23312_cov67-Phaeocystis_antarctica.AAC.7